MRREACDRRNLEPVVEQPDEHDERRGGQQRSGDELAGGQQADAENAPDEHGESADDRDFTVMGLAATGLVDEFDGNCHGTQRRHGQQCCEKTRHGGAEIVNQDIPQIQCRGSLQPA